MNLLKRTHKNAKQGRVPILRKGYNMILADKIINERKKLGWSQEELAEQLSVSRQSISKWEGAQAIPDIQKIIRMADIFGVSTDYLLKDELEPADIASDSTRVESIEPTENVVKVSMEEANDYLLMAESVTPRRANMVSLCILGPAILILLLGLSQVPGCPITEAVATALGVGAIVLMVAVAVFFFITDGMKMRQFSYLDEGRIETLYGVSGMVKERKKLSESSNTAKIALGVILIIVGVIPVVTISVLNVKEYWILFMVSLLIVFVSIGVNLLVRACSSIGMYDRLLQEGDFTVAQKERSPKVSAFATIYWVFVWGGYLLWSFLWDSWSISWLVWPIAGIVFACIMSIINAVSKE